MGAEDLGKENSGGKEEWGCRNKSGQRIMGFCHAPKKNNLQKIGRDCWGKLRWCESGQATRAAPVGGKKYPTEVKSSDGKECTREGERGGRKCQGMTKEEWRTIYREQEDTTLPALKPLNPNKRRNSPGKGEKLLQERGKSSMFQAQPLWGAKRKGEGKKSWEQQKNNRPRGCSKTQAIAISTQQEKRRKRGPLRRKKGVASGGCKGDVKPLGRGAKPKDWPSSWFGHTHDQRTEPTKRKRENAWGDGEGGFSKFKRRSSVR